MTLPLPNLDDRTYADLVDEALTLIRSYQPEWTNYNPSDPGVTLVELFAWLAEMLIYRANQVPDRHRIAFLQLLNGPEWKAQQNASIDDEIATALAAVRERHRAVTVADYEALAHEASRDVARALCVPGRDLSADGEAGRQQPRPGYVSVIVLPVGGIDEAAAKGVRQKVREYLEPRRLLTTQNVIAAPVWSPVSPRVLVMPRADVAEADARESVVAALGRFLDPIVGGRDGIGWPFGRDVYVSELYRVLEALPEVDYLPDIDLSSVCAAGERCAPAPQLWNAQGDLIGLRLAPHALPRLEIGAEAILVSRVFVPVDVVVTVWPEGDDAAAIRAAKAALRKIFDPWAIRLAPETEPWTTTSIAIRNTIGARTVTLTGDAQHVTTDARGFSTLTLAAGELVDVRIDVEVNRTPS
jgi:hypothetical protein